MQIFSLDNSLDFSAPYTRWEHEALQQEYPFPKLSADFKFPLHVSLPVTCFPCQAQSAYFPALNRKCIFSRAYQKVHNFPHLTERAYFPALNWKCIIFRAQDRPHVFPPLSSSFTWAPLLALCYFVLNRPLNKKKCGGFTPVKLTFCALVLRRRRA